MDWLRELLGLPLPNEGWHTGKGNYMMPQPIQQQGGPIGTDGWEPKGMSAAEALGLQTHNAPKQLMSHEPFMTHDKPLPYMNKPEWIRDPRRVKPDHPLYPMADEVWPTWTDTPNTVTGDNEGFLSELLRRKYITQSRVSGEDDKRAQTRFKIQDIIDDIASRKQVSPGQRETMIELLLNKAYNPFQYQMDPKTRRPIPPTIRM